MSCHVLEKSVDDGDGSLYSDETSITYPFLDYCSMTRPLFPHFSYGNTRVLKSFGESYRYPEINLGHGRQMATETVFTQALKPGKK